MLGRFTRFGMLPVLVVVAVLMSLTVVGGAAVKPAPSGATVSPAGSQIQSVLGRDMYETDDTSSTAKPAPAKSRHTFHDGDEHDFMYFSA